MSERTLCEMCLECGSSEEAAGEATEHVWLHRAFGTTACRYVDVCEECASQMEDDSHEDCAACAAATQEATQ